MDECFYRKSAVFCTAFKSNIKKGIVDPIPIDLGPMFEELQSGEIVPCKATIARTQYVEFLLSRFPWASDADIELALDGWDKGTKLILGNEGSECMREVETKEQYHLTLGQ